MKLIGSSGLVYNILTRTWSWLDHSLTSFGNYHSPLKNPGHHYKTNHLRIPKQQIKEEHKKYVVIMKTIECTLQDFESAYKICDSSMANLFI